MIDEKTQKSYVNYGALIHGAIFFLIAVLIVVGNFSAERYFASKNVVYGEQSLTTFDYGTENLIPGGAKIRFAGPTESQSTPSMKVFYSNPEKSEYIFQLESGKIWGNFALDSSKTDIIINSIVFAPDHAIFDLAFDGSTAWLSVYSGDVYIGFLDKNTSLTGYADGYSEIFMNRLLVPKNVKVMIPLNKVDERLKSLLYSKIVKEFKYSKLSEEELKVSWISANLQKDLGDMDNLRKEYVSEAISRGTQSSDSTLGSLVYWGEKNLTVGFKRRDEKVFAKLFSYLSDAVFYSANGQSAHSKEYLSKFDNFLAGMNAKGNEEYKRVFDQYISQLYVFAPGDNLYQILSFLLDKKFAEGRDVYEVVDKFWMDVYEAADLNKSIADTALRAYYKYLQLVFKDHAKDDYYKKYLAYRNQLFDSLFYNYEIFYEDDYFAMKTDIEKNYLDLFDESQLKQELRQDLVSNKIDFLKRLMNLFFEDKIAVDQARKIVARLIKEVDSLMPPDNSGVAVIELFQNRLKDVTSFWGYLNDPEYYASKAYGDDQKTRYEAYLHDNNRIWTFIDIQRDVLGRTATIVVTVADIKKEIEAVLAANESIKSYKVGKIESTEDRYVPVEIEVDGYTVKAEYDREYDALRNVYVYGELISSDSVKLDNLLAILDKKFSPESTDSTISDADDDTATETSAQRIARRYIADMVSKAGFVAAEDNVAIVNEDDNVYKISNVLLSGNANIYVSFYFSMEDEKAYDVSMQFSDQKITLAGKYTLSELHDSVVTEVSGGDTSGHASADGQAQKSVKRKK